jgi:hypothetical protein
MSKIAFLASMAVVPVFALTTAPASSFGRDTGHYAPRAGSGYAYNAPRAARGTMLYGSGVGGTMYYGPTVGGVTAPVEGTTVCSRPYYRSHLGGGASCRSRAYDPEQK